jgi:DnaJ family protein C protein 3
MFRKLKKLDKTINAAIQDFEQNKFVAASKKLVGSGNDQGIIATVDEEVAKLEVTLDAVGKMPRRLSAKLYSLACKIYGQVRASAHDQETIFLANFFHSQRNDWANAKKWCSATLDMDENDQDALLYLGEAAIEDSDYESAVRYLTKAHDASGGQNGQVRETLGKAQRLLKQSKKRDYYKILSKCHIHLLSQPLVV